jgi:hypothetical protein
MRLVRKFIHKTVPAVELRPYLFQSLPEDTFQRSGSTTAGEALLEKAQRHLKAVDTLCLYYSMFAARTMLAACSQLEQLYTSAPFQSSSSVAVSAPLASSFARGQFIEFLSSALDARQFGMACTDLGLPEACSLFSKGGRIVFPLHIASLEDAGSELGQLALADYPSLNEVIAQLQYFRSVATADLAFVLLLEPDVRHWIGGVASKVAGKLRIYFADTFPSSQLRPNMFHSLVRVLSPQ